MEGVLGNLLNALTEIWKSIGIPQKVSIIMIGLLCLMASGVILYMGSRPDWQILYSNLDRETAAKIYDIIQDEGVQVKLASSGTTIMVPSKEVYRLRLKVASEGVAVGEKGVGFELFDDMKLGLTDRQQEVAFQRAMQGELERMITEIPGVVSSKVMLDLPKKRIFKKDNESPSASIMVVLGQGYMLSARQVNSIRYMVASAVANMDPKDVTITDNYGNSLARQESEDELLGGSANRQLEIQEMSERLFKEKAEAILRPIVGVKHVVAIVTCEMDFDTIDKVTEKYAADQQVVISEKTVTEDTSKSDKSGQLKTIDTQETDVKVSNPTAGMNEEVAKEQRQTTQKEYVVPKTVEKVSTKGCRVKNMTVAVTVAQKSETEKWSDDELKHFTALVQAAVGAENYPKSKVEVKTMAFAPVKEPEVHKASILESVTYYSEYVMNSALLRPIGGLVLLLLLYRVFRKYFQKTSSEDMEIGIGGVYGEDLNQLEGLDEQEDVAASLLDSLQNKATASPQQVASMMENWLTAADDNH